jgi:hypothetical protein
MENLFAYLANSFARHLLPTKFRRYFLGSGCSALLLSHPPKLHYKTTRDGERISFYEQPAGQVIYGLIMIPMKDLFTLHQAEMILVQYINRLRKPFAIAYNITMHVEKGDGILTLTDYWQDEQGTDWKIKGYTNGKTISLLYVKNIGHSAVAEHDEFLNGFQFSCIS